MTAKSHSLNNSRHDIYIYIYIYIYILYIYISIHILNKSQIKLVLDGKESLVMAFLVLFFIYIYSILNTWHYVWNFYIGF